MPSRGRILIVDDEVNARSALSEILREEGYATETAADGFKALGKLEDFGPDVVLTDLKMPGLDGIGLMEKVRERAPGTTVVVMTAFGTISNAVEAVQKGAYHYLTKPLDFQALVHVVERALERSRLLAENARLKERLNEKSPAGHIVGKHPAMLAVLKLAEQVAASRATILLRGDTGTGKEIIAELIHNGSPRKDKPLVRLNCAALSESLLESELFGHERGAFTGAVGRREGRFLQADSGTLFLDEVSEIPVPLQVKLLRVLQERSFERVGGNETVHVDVRIIAATNRDLRQRISEGLFREDLFYRLNVVTIEIPRLRDRATDIPELAGYFLARYANEGRQRIEGFTAEALGALSQYAWPGNVRELENVIERAVVLCDTSRIDVSHLPTTIAPSSTRPDELPRVPGATIADLERYAILKTMESCHGSTSRAAAILGISPRKVQYKLREYEGEASPPPESAATPEPRSRRRDDEA